MSPNETSVGCGLDWSLGQLHAGFDAGDGGNGVGGGFTWLPNALSSVIGVHFRDTKVNVNLTITDDNQVIFSVDGKELDWNKVIKATKTQDANIPSGRDAGAVQYYHGHAFANDVPEYHYPDGKEKSTKTKRADLRLARMLDPFNLAEATRLLWTCPSTSMLMARLLTRADFTTAQYF